MTEKEIRSMLDDIHSDILKDEMPLISVDLIEGIQTLIKEKNGQIRRLKRDIKIYEQVMKDSAEGYQIRIAAERKNTIDEFVGRVKNTMQSLNDEYGQVMFHNQVPIATIQHIAHRMKGEKHE